MIDAIENSTQLHTKTTFAVSYVVTIRGTTDLLRKGPRRLYRVGALLTLYRLKGTDAMKKFMLVMPPHQNTSIPLSLEDIEGSMVRATWIGYK